ncbi:MAG: hypothetical protein AABY33_08160 [Pseudomonadota bacterium]
MVDLESCDWLPNKQILVRVSLIAENFGENKIVIPDILKALQAVEQIEAVVKFYDPILYKQHETIYQEIFTIEMSLREVLTYIFLNRFPENPHNLLQYTNITPLYQDKTLAKYIDKRANEHSNNYSNEFFYLLFSHYTNLLDNKKLSEQDVTNLLTETETFEQFRNIILDRGVQNETHKDFLLSIKAILTPIENTRNCIMHNRSLSDDLKSDYERAKTELLDKIENFWAGNYEDSVENWDRLIEQPVAGLKNLLREVITIFIEDQIISNPSHAHVLDKLKKLSAKINMEPLSIWNFNIKKDNNKQLITANGKFASEVSVPEYKGSKELTYIPFFGTFEVEITKDGYLLKAVNIDKNVLVT